MYLSGHPKTKSEAARWLRIGIELTVLDDRNCLPIRQKDGTVDIAGPGWKGFATINGGLVVKIR
jgi:hypothetical protein